MAPRRKRPKLSSDAAENAIASASENPTSLSITTAMTQKDTSRRQLFVRGLAPTVSTEDLTHYFSESYPIKNALVVLDKESKQSKGYGFVTFADLEDAQAAREALHGTELQGKKIQIDVAEARNREGDRDVQKTSDRIKADREQQIKDAQTPKLIVRNLPWSVKTSESLERLFRCYGKVNFATLPKKPGGELRGFGFVSVRGKKNAEKAIAELNGKEIDGRPIAVDWAVDRDTWQDLQTAEQDGAEPADVATAELALNSEVSSVVSSGSESEGGDGESDDDLAESETDYEGILNDDEAGGVELHDGTNAGREEHTIFIRNLPFTVDDDSLMEHFRQFGAIRYARVVVDHETERPKGTAFVSFFEKEDMVQCLHDVPRVKHQKKDLNKKNGSTITVTHSVLEDAEADPTGKYSIHGRVLQLSRAVNKNEATRLTAEGAASRFSRDKDKRRLYLLSEGTISAQSSLYQHLAPSEIKMRDDSAKLRRKQIQENPSLHLSLTRLSIRNVPRSITSKDLKQLARSAIVGFAADVKAGRRNKLSREEVIRGGQEMLVAEKMRKKRGKGIVKQAKVVFETTAGSKVAEDAGAGRSRGYGFIEYYTHRNALMALRWLNGHAVDYKVKSEVPKSKKQAKEALEDKRKRLIVEFAIENANVVSRRASREDKAQEPSKPKVIDEAEVALNGNKPNVPRGKKRRRDSGASTAVGGQTDTKAKRGPSAAREDKSLPAGDVNDKVKLADRSRIIAKKRQARKAKRAGKT